MKQRHFDLWAVGGIFAAYSATIMLALHLNLRDSLLGGLANTIPVVIFGTIARRIILHKLVGRPAAVQLLAHLPLCAAFSALSYGLLIVLLGLFNGWGSSGFTVLPFSASGTAWQTLENVTTYALIAAMSYLQALQGRHATSALSPTAAAGDRKDSVASVALPQAQAAKSAPAAGEPREPTESRSDDERSRYFVRIGDELRPIDVDTIVSIGGADDYAEVRTLSGKHLVRMTLSQFAKSLDPARYARVHRSWIVNVHRIARAESAGGGRLLLHMETGQRISTSRAGAKMLRDRVI